MADKNDARELARCKFCNGTGTRTLVWENGHGSMPCSLCTSDNNTPKNEAREVAQQIEKKYGNCCGDVINIYADDLETELTAYAAAVTQERDALRLQLAQFRTTSMYTDKYGADLEDVKLVARAAAEESQPK